MYDQIYHILLVSVVVIKKSNFSFESQCDFKNASFITPMTIGFHVVDDYVMDSMDASQVHPPSGVLFTICFRTLSTSP